MNKVLDEGMSAYAPYRHLGNYCDEEWDEIIERLKANDEKTTLVIKELKNRIKQHKVVDNVIINQSVLQGFESDEVLAKAKERVKLLNWILEEIEQIESGREE
jgi:ABC-type multidrug transport system permease subunit